MSSERVDGGHRPAEEGSVIWETAGTDAVATVRVGEHEQEVARSSDGSRLQRHDSPRPFLHPIRSLDGQLVTDVAPDDHPHHFGLSLAIADVDGVSHWGGASFTPELGYTMHDNHGVQRLVAQAWRDDRLRQQLEWMAPDGTVQLHEDRVIRVEHTVPATRPALLVTASSELRATGASVSLGSPATNGRAGAGYGGWFWRLAAADAVRVLSPAGEGEELVHGGHAPWLVFVLEWEGRAVSVLFRQPTVSAADDEATAGGSVVFPWFVRAEEYPGVGVALATSERLEISEGWPLRTGLQAVVVDGVLDETEAWAIHRGLAAASGHGDSGLDA